MDKNKYDCWAEEGIHNNPGGATKCVCGKIIFGINPREPLQDKRNFTKEITPEEYDEQIERDDA